LDNTKDKQYSNDKLEQIKMIKDFINVIDFKNLSSEIILDRDKFKKSIENVIKNSVLFTHVNKCKSIFNNECLVKVKK
jgi:hypothetical protein